MARVARPVLPPVCQHCHRLARRQRAGRWRRRGAASVVGDRDGLLAFDQAWRADPEAAQVGGDPLVVAVEGDGAPHLVGEHQLLGGQLGQQRHRHRRDGQRAQAGPDAGEQPGQAVGHRDGEQRVGGQQEPRHGVPDPEQVLGGEGQPAAGGQGRRGTPGGTWHSNGLRAPGRSPAAPPGGQDAQRDKDRQGQPPQAQHRVAPADGAGPAQGGPVQRPEFVPDGQARAQAALFRAGQPQPVQRAAEAQVRLGHPLGRAGFEPTGHAGGQQPVPPRP